MKILIIISILLLILGLSGYYVYVRAMQAFAGTFLTSKIVLVLYVFLISSFLFGKIIENISINFISSSLVRIGGVGAGLFLYAFLFVVLIDFIRLINFAVPFYPKFITTDYQKTKFIVGIIISTAVFIIFIVGCFNARTPTIKQLEITINKSEANFDTLNVVAVSDIHFGTIVNKTKGKRLIKNIRALNPDLVIIAGDIIDDNIDVVKHFKLLEYFKTLKPKYGIYACPGNHEYISRAYTDFDYFERNGIHVLKDSAVLIDNKFYIIGRDDISGKRVSKKGRKSIVELTKNINFELPVFLLDHQPHKLEEAAKYPVDLQFSGHTHNGQIFPFNYITGLLFEEDWGYLKKNNTHFYISAGFGTAIMPIRVGSKSEIVNIKIINK